MIDTCMIKYASEYPCRNRHAHTCMPHTHPRDHTKPHMLPHTASRPPMAPYILPPSLPHSLKRREPVKDARRQHTDRVAVQVEAPGHEMKRQSALTHSTTTCLLCPSACTCLCPMHMPHAHARVHRGSLSLCICMCILCVCACACVRACIHIIYIGLKVYGLEFRLQVPYVLHKNKK